jgi:hypothetical protein
MVYEMIFKKVREYYDFKVYYKNKSGLVPLLFLSAIFASIEVEYFRLL